MLYAAGKRKKQGNRFNGENEPRTASGLLRRLTAQELWSGRALKRRQ